MQAISEVMTRDVASIGPDGTLQEAARLMRDQNIGSVPVCDGKRLVGMITDRDITVRATAEGRRPAEAEVVEVMSDQVLWCYEDQTVGEVLQQMGDEQVRRIPVVSRNMELAGIVALGDLATRVDARTDSTIEDISSPQPPTRPSTGKQPSQH